MKKIMIISVLLFVSLHAGTAYSARGTLVGEIVSIRENHQANSKHYNIDIDMRATGIAKSMSGNLKEHHSSRGTVKDGEFYAKEYKIDKSYKDIHYIRKYQFDYKRKRITKISIKWKKGKKLYEEKITLKYFAHNDILTLYHNIVKYKMKHASGHFTITLAGAEKEGGKLKFVFPSGKQLKKDQNSMDEEEASIIKLYMHRQFLSEGQGHLTFAIDKKGIAQKVVLDSVKLLGKVTLKRVR